MISSVGGGGHTVVVGCRGRWRSDGAEPRYVGLSQWQATRSRRRPWEFAPEPLQRAALRSWGVIPAPIRRALAPLGDVINPGHTTTAEMLPGASTVPGVDAVRAEGFTPIEELTGFTEVALVWPKEHRRAVRETREWWLDEPLQGKVWLVRPPWPTWSLQDVFVFLWSLVDQHRDHQARRDVARDALSWPEERARVQLERARAQL